MSKASGLVLLVAGLSAAAYVVLPSGIDTGEPELPPHFTDVAKIPPPSGASEVALAAPEPQAVAQATTPVAMAREPRPCHPSRRRSSSRSGSARASRPLPSPHRAGPGPRDRDAIGRELQKELKRVGCYEGELNGAWTPLTRQAMKAFTDRVNATLPTDEPDSILLTLVQAYQDKVCGKPCPAGQGLSDIGRCVPTAILARAAKKGAPRRRRRAARREADARDHELVDDDHGGSAHAANRCASDRRPHGSGRADGARGDAASGTPPPGATPPPAATPPVAAKERRPPKVSEGWARNLFRNQQSLN